MRTWATRVGTIELAIPKIRPGSYFPSLLDPRRRAGRALLAVVQEAYVHGVSTRKVDDVLKALGLEGMPKSSGSTRPTTRCGGTTFLRSLVKRDLRGVRLVISDAHEGLKKAPATVLGRGELATLPRALCRPADYAECDLRKPCGTRTSC